MAADAATTGAVRVEKVRGRSTLTRCFARYPLKLIAPSKVGPASCDAVWLYALTYGGGIVSVSPSLSWPAAPSCFLALTDRFPACCASPWHARGTPSLVRSASAIDGCTAAITTQASTKVCFFASVSGSVPCLTNSNSKLLCTCELPRLGQRVCLIVWTFVPSSITK
jgi:hypothetical protein